MGNNFQTKFNLSIPKDNSILCSPHVALPAASPPCSPVIPAGLPSIRKFIANRERVSASRLEYIGMQDERHTVGKMIYLFNILDPSHRRYRSTVSFVETAR